MKLFLIIKLCSKDNHRPYGGNENSISSSQHTEECLTITAVWMLQKELISTTFSSFNHWCRMNSYYDPEIIKLHYMPLMKFSKWSTQYMNIPGFCLSIISPKKKNNSFFLLWDCLNDRISKLLPTFLCMGICFTLPDWKEIKETEN